MQILTLAVTPKVNRKKLVAQQSLQRYFGSFLLGDPKASSRTILPTLDFHQRDKYPTILSLLGYLFSSLFRCHFLLVFDNTTFVAAAPLFPACLFSSILFLIG
jgi:hypothetical protein